MPETLSGQCPERLINTRSCIPIHIYLLMMDSKYLISFDLRSIIPAGQETSVGELVRQAFLGGISAWANWLKKWVFDTAVLSIFLILDSTHILEKCYMGMGVITNEVFD